MIAGHQRRRMPFRSIQDPRNATRFSRSTVCNGQVQVGRSPRPSGTTSIRAAGCRGGGPTQETPVEVATGHEPVADAKTPAAAPRCSTVAARPPLANPER